MGEALKELLLLIPACGMLFGLGFFIGCDHAEKKAKKAEMEREKVRRLLRRYK
ncbi:MULTISPECIES: hypothetical protein [Bacillus]|uniref:hypothetical protein n=1 Tax=Bacillus TaxID=1386 RepID=UPI001377D307|nr:MULTISPECIES: hypothetical protein [Bacillus]MCM3425548.1 hypothetical protein [Bacillus paralicheniformis]MCY8531030.1 hypothetical protein [Bacillus licheniformis]MCY9434146.1 hypothetical protein [Bacillus haynesii]MEC0754584.1 hypothetical protein [Bacillus haynesii]MED4546977.1 hypothetical protein [Bacillus licheniformis]